MTKHETTPAAQQARIVIVGPQGSGKGTQGARISEILGIPTIVTGDLFRKNIKEGTELGKQVESVINAGALVSDELTFDLIKDRMNAGDTGGGFLLDGFPRNLSQVGLLDSYLDPRDESLVAVVNLDVPRDVSISRLSARAAEQGRADDTAEAISKRLEVYELETAPILHVYQDRGILDVVNGVGSEEKITHRILHALEARGIAVPQA